MEHLPFVISLFLGATVFALLEIQIEDGVGWAANLPTWRIDNRWTRVLLGGRPLTGYHLYCHLFLIVAAHLPFGLRLVPFSAAAEARILAYIVLFWILEDFLWFVLNPRYRLAGFRRENIAWHARAWWWFMPREYWIFTPPALGLYFWSL